METIDDFRQRARAWLAATMPQLPAGGYPTNPMASDPVDRFSRARDLQRRLWDGGFAGLTFPTDAGGSGLPFEYQATFLEEADGYEMPLRFSMPTLGIIGATFLDFGTPEQRARFLPPMLRGETLWVQLLSEPSCGSDLAGVRMRATRDGDVFILNGEKVWSSAAYGCDWGLCLARTNWSVPKHAGLTMLAIDLTSPGVHVRPIRQVDGSEEFCSVHLEDVAVPVAHVLGEIDGGWKVATALMGHERDSVGGGSPYIGNVRIHSARTIGRALPRLQSASPLPPAIARDLAARHHVEGRVGDWLVQRIGAGVERGIFHGPAGAVLRLYKATQSVLEATIDQELAGMAAVVWGADASDPNVGVRYVRRQANCLAGGSSEMQRNLISERLLGMPRESAPDRDRPFADVPSSRREDPRRAS